MASDPQSQGAAIEDYFVEDRTFPPPADFAADALVTDAEIYDEAEADWQGFWARQAADLVTWYDEWDTILDWDLPVRQVVRRRHAQRVVQLPRPPRRGRPGRPGRLPLGGRAGRHPHHHLRRPARRGAALRQRAQGPRASRKGDRVAIYMPMIPELPVAMLACARIGAAALGRVRRLLGRLAGRPHQRRRVQGARHRRRRLPAGRRPTCSSPSPTSRWPSTPSIEHVVVVDRVPARRRRRRRRRHDRGPRPLVPRPHGRRPTPTCAPERDGQRGPALPALHVGHHGQAQGHHAHHRRLPHPGRVHPQVRLRPPARDRRLLVRGRHRLGHRPQLHRLRAARQRRHRRSSTRARPTRRARTGCGTSSSATASRSSTPRPPPSARS